MTEYSGRTEPERILPLLWRRRGTSPARPGAGRPPKLTVDDVVAAAITVADADGLAAMSMARIATALGVGTWTLYTFAPSRAALIDLMVDDVLAGRRLPGPGEERPAHWRAQVELYAERTHAMYRAHPWLCQVATARPPIGPGMLAEREYVLSTVSGLGLPLDVVNVAAVTITAFVQATARFEGESAQLRRSSGLSNDEWWLRRDRLWEEYFDVDRHPAMTRLWEAGGFATGPDGQLAQAHAYGLRLLLDGIERDVSPA